MLKVRDLVFPHSTEQSDPITFEVNKSEILGIIGPSGAGAEKLISCLAMPEHIRHGQILLGHVSADTDTEKYRQLIGFLPNPVVVEKHLTGIEFLELIGSSYGLDPAERLPMILELADRLNCREDLYSMLDDSEAHIKQKVAIIGAVMHKPKAVFLFEPWQNLDWSDQLLLNELLNDLAKDGSVVIITSHSLEKLDQICDKILVMNQGASLAIGTTKEISRQFNLDQKTLPKIWEELAKTKRIQSD